MLDYKKLRKEFRELLDNFSEKDLIKWLEKNTQSKQETKTMIREYKPQLVTFEQAKKLKSLGFNLECCHFFDETGELHAREIFSESRALTPTDFYEDFNSWADTLIDDKIYDIYSAPEVFQVIEWLEAKYEIWIWLEKFQTETQYYFTAWYQEIYKEDKIILREIPEGKYDPSPHAFNTQYVAYLEAISQIINKL